MIQEQAFNAATFAFASYKALLGTLAQQFGAEEALGLQAQANEMTGAVQGKTIREQAGVGDVDAQTASALLEHVLTTIGMSAETIEASPEKVVTRASRCPIYEAGLALGMEPAEIEAQCRTGAIVFMNAAAKQLNPGLRYELASFRSSAEEGCVEQIVMG
jgi:hypothetical protein